MAALAVIPIGQESAVVRAHSFSRAEAYERNSKAENTRRGYRSDWRGFDAWCTSAGLASLPAAPETVALYIAALAEQHKPATIGRHLAAIANIHKARGHSSPASMQHGAVSAVWKGIKRTHGTKQRQVSPLLTADLRKIAGACGDRLLDVRDRAVLLLGFAGAFRRGEIAALDRTDLVETGEGFRAEVRRSKTDQTGQGLAKAIVYGSDPATCPVRALKLWLERSAIVTGPLFRGVDRHGRLLDRAMSGAAVAILLKRHVAAVGIVGDYSGHSLRAGFVTQAYIAGAQDRDIMRQSGHKSVAITRRYDRDTNLFRGCAAARLGL